MSSSFKRPNQIGDNREKMIVCCIQESQTNVVLHFIDCYWDTSLNISAQFITCSKLSC